MDSNSSIVRRIFRCHNIEPTWIAVVRTSVSLVSIGLMLAFAYDLIKQIKDEHFSTRDNTTVEPFDNLTKFGMVEMPSVLVYTNILSQPSFSASPYLSVDVFIDCWNPEQGVGSFCPCTQSWHESLVQDSQDQTQWNPSYQCNVCSCSAPLRTDAIYVNISMDPTWVTSFGVYDNTQLLLFDPNSQALGHVSSYLNKTGEPNERAFQTPFSLYYNFGVILRYNVEYSRRNVLKGSWRDVLGLPGLYQSVNMYTIDPIPQNGFPVSQELMTAVLYPGWGISPGGQGFVVTEEFRTHTVLAMLASLGGLWTILSALFSSLFGRGILFPIFGNKPVSAFGLIGNLCFGLRRKLQDNFENHQRAQIQDKGLHQFIWDFVLDMSPLKISEEKEIGSPRTVNGY